MKATSSRQPSSVASGILKLVGVILILSSLLDYAILLIPPGRLSNANPEQAQLALFQWQQTVTSQLIDRGVIPMVGLAFLFAAFWIDTASGTNGKSGLQALLKPGALILSILLGLAFLLPVPALNFTSLRWLNNRAVEQISQQADQAETQLRNQAQQVTALAQDQQQLTRLNQAIGEAQGDQLARLQQIRDLLQTARQDPSRVNQRVKELQTQIRSQQQQAQQQRRTEFVKTLVRSVTSSLFLAIGYLAIGLIGLRSLGGGRAKR